MSESILDEDEEEEEERDEEEEINKEEEEEEVEEESIDEDLFYVNVQKYHMFVLQIVIYKYVNQV